MAQPDIPLVRYEPLPALPASSTSPDIPLNKMDNALQKLFMVFETVLHTEVTEKNNLGRDFLSFTAKLLSRTEASSTTENEEHFIAIRNEFTSQSNEILKQLDSINDTSNVFETPNPEQRLSLLLNLEKEVINLKSRISSLGPNYGRAKISQAAITSVLGAKLVELGTIIKEISSAKENLEFELHIVSKHQMYGLVPNILTNLAKQGSKEYMVNDQEYHVSNQFLKDLSRIVTFNGRKGMSIENIIKKFQGIGMGSAAIERTFYLANQASTVESNVIVAEMIKSLYSPPGEPEDPMNAKIVSFTHVNANISIPENFQLSAATPFNTPSINLILRFKAKDSEEILYGNGKMVLTISDILNSQTDEVDAVCTVSFRQ